MHGLLSNKTSSNSYIHLQAKVSSLMSNTLAIMNFFQAEAVMVTQR